MPKRYHDIDISYFEEAVDVLEAMPEVERGRVGVWGLSQGGNIVLAMMQFVPDRVRAGVVVGSPFASWPGRITYGGQEIPPIEAKMEIVDNLVTPRAQDLAELVDQTKQIYFENSPADLLVIEGKVGSAISQYL